MVLAPKLSVFRRVFERKQVDIAAFYKETCGGVDDTTVAIREQIATHELDYPVFDTTSGKVTNPLEKRFRWAPYGLVVDRAGVVVKEYGHLPRLEQIESDLRTLLTYGMIPEVAAIGWRDLRFKSWVEIEFKGGMDPRVEKRSKYRIERDDAVLSVETVYPSGRETTKKMRVTIRPPVEVKTGLVRRQGKDRSIDIDGKIYLCRVVEETFANTADFERRSWIARDPHLRDQLLRQETTRTSKGGVVLRSVRRIRTLHSPIVVGERTLDCWVVEESSNWGTGSEVKVRWLTKAVPGWVVKSETAVTAHGATQRSSSRVIDFGIPGKTL